GERHNGHRYQIPEDAVYMQNSVQCRLEPGEEILRRALLIHHLTRREAVICRYGGVPLGHNGNELSARRLHARRIGDREGPLKGAKPAVDVHERRLGHDFKIPGESWTAASDRAVPLP